MLNLDERKRIQTLDRTQPGPPVKKGHAETMTHDYQRNGATTLFAALNGLDDTVIGQNMQRHRHQEFIRFLNAIERKIPVDKVVHVIRQRRSGGERSLIWNAAFARPSGPGGREDEGDVDEIDVVPPR